jgi:hypothetical protein
VFARARLLEKSPHGALTFITIDDPVWTPNVEIVLSSVQIDIDQ